MWPGATIETEEVDLLRLVEGPCLTACDMEYAEANFGDPFRGFDDDNTSWPSAESSTKPTEPNG